MVRSEKELVNNGEISIFYYPKRQRDRERKSKKRKRKGNREFVLKSSLSFVALFLAFMQMKVLYWMSYIP